MEIRKRTENGILILSVDGRLDHDAAETFRKTASQHIEDGQTSILVDFGGTTFLASMGIRALILPSQEAAQRGGKLAITGLSGELEKLFAVAGLHKLFTVYPTVADAIGSDAWPARG